jgi:predicted DNA-binding transcriptional regulator AlpA
MSSNSLSDRLINEEQAHVIDDLSRSGRYVAMHKRGYPMPIRTGKANRWPEAAVRAWVAAQMTGRLGPPPEAAIEAAKARRDRGDQVTT